jgi:hypothetical protein
MPPAPLPPANRVKSRPLTPLSNGDKIAIAIFIILPLALYGIPAIAGHLVTTGDNLNQNLPLRILAGQFIRSGQLPLWNPLIWSGSPLLGGWNAGALFPGTLLFAFLPISLAWTINLALAPVLGAIGLYLLLRRFALMEITAAFGASIFAYTGFMAGQIIHLGLDQGTAFTPWILLAIDIFLRPNISASDEFSPDERPWARLRTPNTVLWVLILAISIACTVLAGDPRAISSGAIIAGIYLVALLTRQHARIRSGSLPILSGLIIGFMLSAIQLLPGIAFLRASQRGSVGLSFFGTGSLPLAEISSYLLLPFALGANGSLGLPSFDGNYNLPEVTIGAGLIALMAFGSYLPTIGGSLLATLNRRRSRRENEARRQLGVWFILVIVGVFLTLGTDTPLGRLLVHIPFYGTERLQNRNAVLIDIGLAVFAAVFVDDVLRAVATKTISELKIRSRAAMTLGMVPVLCCLAFIAIELALPLNVQRFLRADGSNPSLGVQLLGYLIPSALIALALGMFWVLCRRLRADVARRVLLAIALCEIGLFVINSSFATVPTSLYSGSNTYSTQLKHLLGGQGRFALYDPYYEITFSDATFTDEIGLPDLNAVQNNPSIQGYGSLVNNVYQSVTGSHLLDDLNPSVLPSVSVNTLDLRIFLTPPGYLEHRLTSLQAVPLPSALDHLAPGIPWLNTGPWKLNPGASTEWQLPGPTTLKRAELVLSGSHDPSQPLAVTLYNGAKVVGHATAVKRPKNTDLIQLNSSVPVTTIELTDSANAPVTVNAITVLNTTHERYVLNGLLQGALTTPHWVYDGQIGVLTAYKNTEIHGLAWLQAATTHTPNTRLATSGKVVITRGAATASQVMHVTTSTAAILVRSEAYSAGWHVDVTPLKGGRSMTLPVHRFGLIQDVDLPRGSWRVTWHYQPRSAIEGLVLSAVGALVVVLFVVLLLVGWRRRRRALG